jgi:hypothetical protein
MRNADSQAAPEMIRAVLEYDGSCGLFRWKRPVRTMARGWFAGSLHASGYMIIQVNRRPYGAHRLAFAIVNGEWPAAEVDHRDRDRSNNRWANLRQATSAQNGANRAPWSAKPSGLPKGVFPAPRNSGRFVAKLGVGGRIKHLGTFDTVDDAAAAYRLAAEISSGEFAHHDHEGRESGDTRDTARTEGGL